MVKKHLRAMERSMTERLPHEIRSRALEELHFIKYCEIESWGVALS